MKYIGRFAPTPSGPLHLGSLVAAMASYAESKIQKGLWKLRIDDIDKHREHPGARDIILRQLEQLGFAWDGEVAYQNHFDEYQYAIEQLRQQALLYPCFCNRKKRLKFSHQAYPGYCRNQIFSEQSKSYSIRIKTGKNAIQFEDKIQGMQIMHLNQLDGDFIVYRADQLFAYHLACVIDDKLMGVTHIVRGQDLLNSSFNQIYLQHKLRFATPQYTHIPLIHNQQGEKLSKSSHAPPLKGSLEELLQAATHLGYHFSRQQMPQSIEEFWQVLLTLKPQLNTDKENNMLNIG